MSAPRNSYTYNSLTFFEPRARWMPIHPCLYTISDRLTPCNFGGSTEPFTNVQSMYQTFSSAPCMGARLKKVPYRLRDHDKAICCPWAITCTAESGCLGRALAPRSYPSQPLWVWLLKRVCLPCEAVAN